MKKMRKGMGKRCIAVWVILALCVCLIPSGGQAAELPAYFSMKHVAEEGMPSFNLSLNNYVRWPLVPDSSYLAEEKDGSILRVEAIYRSGEDTGYDVAIEKYSKDFALQSQKVIPSELRDFGGFLAGEDCYFLVYGQSNTEESDTKEVLRVVKYDKEWNRIASASLYGSNTTAPFEAGSLRMAEDKDYLYIHTCHKMYTSSDGLRHQANMSFAVRKSTMEITQKQTDVSWLQSGYVSHSFNQFITLDDDYVYRMDHGDAYPRALVVTKCSKKDITNCSAALLLEMYGSTGDNSTGVSVGGFEMAGNRLIAAANASEQSEEGFVEDTRNIIIFSLEKNLTDQKQIWLTNYKKEDGVKVRTPHLLKVSDDRLCVFWEEKDSERNIVVKAAVIDQYGTKISGIYTIIGNLSTCKPIYTADGKIIWYTAGIEDNFQNDSAPVFYNLVYDRLSDYDVTNRIAMKQCDIKVQASIPFTGETSYPELNNNKLHVPEISISYKGYTLREGEDYELSYQRAHIPGTASVTFQGLGLFKGSVTKKYTIAVKKPGTVTNVKITKPKKKSNPFVVTWNKAIRADGYEIQMASNAKFTKNKKTYQVKENKTFGFVADGKKVCYVRVRAYRNALEEDEWGVWISSDDYIYGKWSAVKKIQYK